MKKILKALMFAIFMLLFATTISLLYILFQYIGFADWLAELLSWLCACIALYLLVLDDEQKYGE